MRCGFFIDGVFALVCITTQCLGMVRNCADFDEGPSMTHMMLTVLWLPRAGAIYG
jgi:hypothetical protein